MRPNWWKLLLISGLLLPLPFAALAQSDQRSRILVIDGQPGKAPIIEKNGRAYVDLEALTENTHGSLSFKVDRIVLTLPTLTLSTPIAEPPTGPGNSLIDGLSRDFMHAGIEEIATMREWANTLAYGIQDGYPVSEHWAVNFREQAAHDLRLAAVAVSTESDRNALQLLTTEFEAVHNWTNTLVQERKAGDTAYAPSDNRRMILRLRRS